MYFGIYWIIALYIGAFVLYDLLKGEKLKDQITAFIVLIPFILRILLIK